MKFVFDVKKSQLNLQKHGIDFVAAQALWDDPGLMEIATRLVKREMRSILIGRIGATHWTAVVTYRANFTRLISVRRARTEEIQFYGTGRF